MQINNDYTAFVGTNPLSDNTSSLGASGKIPVAPKESFDTLFDAEVRRSEEGIRFSKHALNRISQRDISIEPDLITKVASAVDNAEEKGITDALILGGNSAFIVNVPTRTVITTMNSNEMKENVITNIDGTVII